MKKTIEDIKTAVLKMPLKEKDKLLMQLLRKNTEAIQKIYYQHVSDLEEIEELILNLKDEITDILSWEYSKGGIVQKKLAKGISMASKLIAQYKTVISPEQETELYMHLLDIVFSDLSEELGTCWTVFDHKVAQTVSKTVTLVSKKIDEDYRIEFEEELNQYLSRLKKKSSHLEYVYNLPVQIKY